MSKALTYSRNIFDVRDELSARRIILTPEFGLSTEDRWERETPYLADLIGSELKPESGKLYIDYGCGIGRMSKILIERFDCRILGVDISERMRALAPDYVQSQQFSVVSPHMLHSLVAAGTRVDGALTVWVLQHCLAPKVDLDLIQSALKPGARLSVVNLKGRAVPTAEGKWANDGIDVQELLLERFKLISEKMLDPEVITPESSSISFYGTYSR